AIWPPSPRRLHPGCGRGEIGHGRCAFCSCCRSRNAMDAGRRAALMARHGSVFSIPPDAPFLATLAEALLDGRLTPDWPREGPFWLSDITLSLPTRRAATALSRLIAGRLGASPLLLPDIRPLGGEDLSQEPFLPPYEPIALPPAINRFKRRL